MTDRDDGELRDAALHDEIELVSDLIVAASTVDGPLSSSEIDDALGICGAPPQTVPRGVPGPVTHRPSEPVAHRPSGSVAR